MKTQFSFSINSTFGKLLENFSSRTMKSLGHKPASWLYMMFVVFLFGMQSTQAQSKVEVEPSQQKVTVVGVVTDGQEPLQGVNVILQGASIGVSTNEKGEFKFPQQLKEGDVLLFSFLGFDSKKIKIKNNTGKIQLKLNPEMQEMDELVLLGAVSSKKLFSSDQ